MPTKHKLSIDWDPEFKRWSGSCSCNKWAIVDVKVKTKIASEFDKHVKGK